MENTWIYRGQEPIKIKKYLQTLGMGHRMFNDIKNGAGEFQVDHRTVRPTTKILPNQPLTIKVVPEFPNPDVQPSHGALEIVFEDANWLVVNKPAGLASIPGPTTGDDTLLNRLTGYLMDQDSPDQRPHLITRLDRFTSGLLLAAKHQVAVSMISQQVQQHRMVKEYQAIVEGVLENGHGLIEEPIARVAGQARREVSADGQPARTEYWVEERGDDWTLVRVRLHTGRTHQIRVHFSYLGHPLLGDHLYGGQTAKFDHQLLCASHIAFDDPFTLQHRDFTIELPATFAQAMAR
ncbi:RluA family pseudouridine synthase [Limosilactobacillus allomucosae]|uniref:RluA family pseudouridine synthase n=1 Tax=Limosilactobacillus allomucosae TaxID=3142938 RepID=UPI0032638F5F